MIIVRSILLCQNEATIRSVKYPFYPRVGKQGFSPSRRENGP